ncbi:MAG: hypothetical protein EXS18_03660 [Verrucomicrobiae bacterium]|nr:hypothetical protein [Verrucomicrobiae bacterium]
MKKLISLLILIGAFVALGSLYCQVQRTEAQIDSLTVRLAAIKTDNAQLKQALATDAKPAGTDAAVRKELEGAVEQLHLLKFKQPIQYRTMKTGEFKDFMQKKINEVYTKEELEMYSRAMALLGLVPDGTDISKIILGLYNEQVAAFYDQHKSELYTFSDFSLSENIDRMMLSHEMTHALQDQTFNLKKFPLEVKDNDDLTLSTSALIEGDATLLMTLWYMQHAMQNLDFSSLFKDLGSMFSQNTEQLAAAPAYFQQTLLFPYQQGNEFVMALYTEGGYGAINKAFEKPPVSTEQILHPQKFMKREDPVEVKLTELKIAGWKSAFANVVGELGTRILLEQNVTKFEATRAAEGWGGDRYEVFKDGTGKLALLWVTVWDTETDAREFQEAFDAAAHKRTGQTSVKHAADESGWMQYGSDAFQVALRKNGSQVTVALGPKESVAKIVGALGK